jgi:hypothetical protein
MVFEGILPIQTTEETGDGHLDAKGRIKRGSSLLLENNCASLHHHAHDGRFHSLSGQMLSIVFLGHTILGIKGE